jgi:two-component system, OmpR family, sensor histidine kinase KdpD
VRRELLTSINQEIDYLTRLVQNLLDMSRIEAGSLKPNREWLPFEDLVEGALRRAAPVIKDRPVEIKMVELPPVYVDAVEIQQVLVNLLDNAAKYAHPGTAIRLQAWAGHGNVSVRVVNEGAGIPKEDLSRVFDRFYRARSGRDRKVPGTGLGLAICKGFVEAHGGSIWAESTPDRETSILFTIPITEALPKMPLERIEST